MTDHLLRVWGRDQDVVAKVRGPDAVEPEDGAMAYWFASAAERQTFVDGIRRSGVMVVHSLVDNDHVRKLTWARVMLSHDGVSYKYAQCFGFGYEAEHVEYMYGEGNYGCDCNRSAFIARHAKAEFPRLDCGNKIEIVEFDVVFLELGVAP